LRAATAVSVVLALVLIVSMSWVGDSQPEDPLVAKYNQVKPGMCESEVHVILGPPGVFTDFSGSLICINDCSGPTLCWQRWYFSGHTIEVFYSKNSMVVMGKIIDPPIKPEDPTMWQRVKKRIEDFVARLRAALV